MTELEKIAYAKSFIDKLAQGINPIDETPIPENDIANNVRLSRCFFYVSDILRQVIDNGGVSNVKPIKVKKADFKITQEERRKIKISDVPLSSKDIVDNLNSIINVETTKKISSNAINEWLVELGLLEVVEFSNGKHRKLPTSQGNDMGIFTEEREGQYGKYIIVMFSPDAQQFIYDNIEGIIENKNKKYSGEFQGSAWTKEQDQQLIYLFKNNTPLAEMASIMKRSEGGIRARLKRLGLIENRYDI